MKNKSKQGSNYGEWKMIRAGDIFTFIKSYAFSRENLSRGILSKKDIGNIHYGDIHSTFTSFSIDLSVVEIPIIKERRFNPKKEELLKDGDLIIADTSEDYEGVGVAVSIHGLEGRKAVGGLHTFVLRDNKGITNEYYRQYIFRNLKVRNSLQKVANGVSVYGISKKAVSDILLSIPSLPEQNRIIAVLEIWDEAIEKLAKKIEIKKQIKKGLMQDLLSGKKRLVEFRDKWNAQKINDIFYIKKGFGLSKDKLSNVGKYECVLYGELYTIYGELITYIKSKTNVRDGALSKSGDVLIPASTTTGALDLAIASCIERKDVLIGGDINILRPKKEVDSRFFAFYLTHIKKHNLARLAQGVTIFHLYASDFKKIEIEIPEIKEQTAIAKIILIADKEISELENKLSLIRDQKKYLLDNLITGTIRVPETLKIYANI